MATPSKADGRNVWEFSDRIKKLIPELEAALREPLGSTDPVDFQKAMKDALAISGEIRYWNDEINDICKFAAKRGEYGEDDE